MNWAEMIVLIVLISAVAGVLRARYGVVRTGRGKEEIYVGHLHRENDAEKEILRGEVRDLKERIAVLERLATDDAGPRALEREIDALRLRDS